MLRVFLDANVLFSASNLGSHIARLISLLTDTGQAVTSDFAFEEARRNVTLKRPAWGEALTALIKQVELVPSIQFDLSIDLATKDQPILCTAIRSRCQYLVTGDRRDFGHLYEQTVEGVTIITLVRLAEILIQQARN